MSTEKLSIPKWVKIWNLIIGIEFLTASVLLLISYKTLQDNVEIFLAVNLVIFGLIKFTNITVHNLYSKKLIIVDIIIGIGAFGAGLYLIFNLTTAFSIYMIILAGIFVLQGAYRFFNGIFNRKLSSWASFYNVLLGLALITLSIFIWFYRDESGTVLNLLLAALFFVNSIGRIGSSIRGYIKHTK